MSIETTPLDDLSTQLGDAIADSPEYRRFEEAKETVENSEEAQHEIQQFEQLRQEFMLARQTGDATQADMQKLQRAQQELHELPIMHEYLEAQEALTERLEDLNRAISDPLALDFGQQAGGCCQDD